MRSDVGTVFDIVIVGAGPAGASAAIRLAQRGFAERTLLLDSARFPREKLCGGGVVRQTDRLLSFLGVDLDVPSVQIDTIHFEYEGGRSVHRAQKMFRVVRREEFDHALLLEAERRGVTVRQGEPVACLERAPDGIVVQAGGHSYRARIVIGADGAKSIVRRTFVGGHSTRFVALEVLTSIDQGVEASPASVEANTAVFDFRPAARGLRGYYWDFPSVRAGQPLMNRGLGGAKWADDVSLKQLFSDQLGQRGVTLGHHDLQGATAPLYDPATPQSAPHVLLAGDAVGIDPWFGEGISTAIGTGILAANTAAEALDSGSFVFGDYRRRLHSSAIGWSLRRNRATARAFYRSAPRPLGLAPWFGITEVMQ